MFQSEKHQISSNAYHKSSKKHIKELVLNEDRTENKIIKNKFTWLPQEDRGSKFGSPIPPRKPETRKPVLWLIDLQKTKGLGRELYLVNLSGEILDYVVVNDNKYSYKNVESGDAAKVDDYDDYYDLDYTISLDIEVKSEKLGIVKLRSPSKKEGISEAVLLWDNGELANGVVDLGNK